MRSNVMSRLSFLLLVCAFFKFIASSDNSGEGLLLLTSSDSSGSFFEDLVEVTSEISEDHEVQSGISEDDDGVTWETHRFLMHSNVMVPHYESYTMIFAMAASFFQMGSALICVSEDRMGTCSFRTTSMAIAGITLIPTIAMLIMEWCRIMATISSRSDSFPMLMTMMLLKTILFICLPIGSILEGNFDASVAASAVTGTANFLAVASLSPSFSYKLLQYYNQPRDDLHLALKLGDHSRATELLDKISLQSEEAVKLLADALASKKPSIISFFLDGISFNECGPVEVLQVIEAGLVDAEMMIDMKVLGDEVPEVDRRIRRMILSLLFDRFAHLRPGELEASVLGRRSKRILQSFHIFKMLLLFLDTAYPMIFDVICHATRLLLDFEQPLTA